MAEAAITCVSEFVLKNPPNPSLILTVTGVEQSALCEVAHEKLLNMVPFGAVIVTPLVLKRLVCTINCDLGVGVFVGVPVGEPVGVGVVVTVEVGCNATIWPPVTETPPPVTETAPETVTPPAPPHPGGCGIQTFWPVTVPVAVTCTKTLALTCG